MPQAASNPRRRSSARERSLADDCQYLKGVGPAKAIKFRNIGIGNVNELLTHFPRKYFDRRNLTPIGEIPTGAESTFVGQVLTSSNRRPRGRGAIVTAAIGDDTGVIQVVWFNQPFLLKHLKPGRQIILSGELRHFRGQRQVVNPDFELIGEDLDEQLISGGRIVPVYSLTQGITQRNLRALMMRVLDDYRDVIEENLPDSVVEEFRLPTRYEAIRAMHFPEDLDERERALTRIKVEELFYMQLVLTLLRRNRANDSRRRRLDVTFELTDRFVEKLPFKLTGAQQKVLEQIKQDVTSTRGMNRLLQGDVGSGKTIVACAALLAAVESGSQAAMMVPTEILALQHFRTLTPYLDALGVRAACLVGSLKPVDKRRVHAGIADGTFQLVVGTHALIQSEVNFKDLGLVVIDEQHRFGVRQRAALIRDGQSPHLLVMTATPIPRTLAMCAYADLDLSVIDEMPASRAPVTTRIVPPEKRAAMYDYIRERQENGEQSFLLYPLVEETEKQDLEAAESAYAELSKGPLKGVRLGLLHGRMSLADKERVMTLFLSGDIRVLVTTTVVEVGVHVPSATIMAVHHPERFGLSQLHQLRGRVGRGGREGFCFLLTGEHVAPETMRRLEVLVDEADGFRIAEEDLRIRGPGEFLGTRQHGVPGFKVANPLSDQRLVERTGQVVRRLLETDPGLRTADGMRCRRHIAAIVTEDMITLMTA